MTISQMRSYPMLRLALAQQALTEAESFKVAEDQVIRLCDDVIRRNLAMETLRIMNGSTFSRAKRVQMVRDRHLLNASCRGWTRVYDEAR
jgi:hypothetical protein